MSVFVPPQLLGDHGQPWLLQSMTSCTAPPSGQDLNLFFILPKIEKLETPKLSMDLTSHNSYLQEGINAS